MKKYIKRGLIGLIIGTVLEIFVFNFLFIQSGFDIQILDINISRIVAVVLIAVVGTFLFSIQKMPDYHIGDQDK